MQALVLTGPIGSGKTAVAQEIVAVAEEHGMSVAAIDLDWLCWSTGAAASAGEMLARNLAPIAANYAAARVTRLVLARAMVLESGEDAIAGALPGWSVTVVALAAGRPLLEERLRRRDAGAELEHNLAHMAVSMQTPAGAKTVVNEGRPLREVAIDVMSAAGWL